MKTATEYPEIEKMNLTDTHAAINLGSLNLSALKPEHRPDAERRLKALHEHAANLRAGVAKAAGKKLRARKPKPAAAPTPAAQ